MRAAVLAPKLKHRNPFTFASPAASRALEDRLLVAEVGSNSDHLGAPLGSAVRSRWLLPQFAGGRIKSDRIVSRVDNSGSNGTRR